MAELYKKLTDYIPLIENDKFGEWIIDQENDGMMKHPIPFPYVSYSEMVANLENDIYGLEYGLNCYGEILEQNHREWGTESIHN